MSDDIEQRSPEWIVRRLGFCGCSRLGDVLATGRSGAPSATRKNYMHELLCERLTGIHNESYTSKEMLWGVDNEPIARSCYEATRGVMVQEKGGMEHPDIPWWWGSPDGLIAEDGGIEIKCPNTSTHLETVMYGKIKTDYIYQMAGYVEIFKRDWWDFVSFDPRLPENVSLYVKRFTRDELPIDEVKDGVTKFLDELNALEAKVKALGSTISA